MAPGTDRQRSFDELGSGGGAAGIDVEAHHICSAVLHEAVAIGGRSGSGRFDQDEACAGRGAIRRPYPGLKAEICRTHRGVVSHLHIVVDPVEEEAGADSAGGKGGAIHLCAGVTEHHFTGTALTGPPGHGTGERRGSGCPSIRSGATTGEQRLRIRGELRGRRDGARIHHHRGADEIQCVALRAGTAEAIRAANGEGIVPRCCRGSRRATEDATGAQAHARGQRAGGDRVGVAPCPAGGVQRERRVSHILRGEAERAG